MYILIIYIIIVGSGAYGVVISCEDTNSETPPE